MEIPIIAHRRPVVTYDTVSGHRWRGGVVRERAGEDVIVEVMAEVGSPRRYRGPAGDLNVGAPIACRMTGVWPYSIAEIIDAFWASGADESLALQGVPGIVGCIPWSILERDWLLMPADERPSRILWRQDVTTVISAGGLLW
jgi:hypothetical protein